MAEKNSKLPSSVRDACLRAMRLLGDHDPPGGLDKKEIFERLYVWTKAAHVGQSKGTTLALALVYTRLVVAFGQRKQKPKKSSKEGKEAKSTNASATTPAKESAGASDKEPTKTTADTTTTPPASEEKKKSPPSESSKATKAAEKSHKSASFPSIGTKHKIGMPIASKLDLSAKVAEILYGMANDLADVHALLAQATTPGASIATTTAAPNVASSPKSPSTAAWFAAASTKDGTREWLHWSVAAIFVTARSRMEGIYRRKGLAQLQEDLAAAGGGGGQGRGILDPSNVRIFTTFATRALDWAAGKVVRGVEAYRDFLYVTEQSLQSKNDKKTWEALHKTRVDFFSLICSSWEDPVPGMSLTLESDAAKSDGTMVIGEPEVVQDEMARVLEVTWKLAVGTALDDQLRSADDPEIPTRRQRLVASCAAVALVTGLGLLANQGGESNKRRKLPDGSYQTVTVTELAQDTARDILPELVKAANQEAAFTRWACLGRWKIACDVRQEEVVEKMVDMAKILCAHIEKNREKLMPLYMVSSTRTTESSESGTGDKLPAWVMSLKLTAGGNQVFPFSRLPRMVQDFYESKVHKLRGSRVRVEAAPFFNEVVVCGMEDIDTLCTLLDRPMESGDGHAVVVAPGAESALPAIAAGVEKEVSDLSTSKEAAEAIRRSLSPAVLTEAMELNEWAISVLYVDPVQPSEKLLGLLGGQFQAWRNFVTPIINRSMLHLAQQSLTEKTGRKAPVTLNKQTGLLVHGELTHDRSLCKGLVALYYHAFEAILFSEAIRLGGHAPQNIFQNESFHRALLACCCSCLLRAVGATHRIRPDPKIQVLQIYSVLQLCESNPYDFLKVSGAFLRSMTREAARGKVRSPLVFALPRYIERDFKLTQQNVMDSLLWARDPKFEESFPEKIDDFVEKTLEKKDVRWWPVEELSPSLPEEVDDYKEPEGIKYPSPGMEDYAEYKSVSALIRRVMTQAFGRIRMLCRALEVPPSTLFETHVWVAFRYLLRYRVGLFFDRHVDHWILACIYGVGRQLKYKPEIKFAEIIKAYVDLRGPELGDVTCQRIVRHIKINSRDNDPSQVGNVIILYNKVFVPAMKDHLLKSISLKRAAKQLEAMRASDREGEQLVQVQLQSPSAHLKAKEGMVGNEVVNGSPQAVLRFGEAPRTPAGETKSARNEEGVSEPEQEKTSEPMDEKMSEPTEETAAAEEGEAAPGEEKQAETEKEETSKPIEEQAMEDGETSRAEQKESEPDKEKTPAPADVTDTATDEKTASDEPIEKTSAPGGETTTPTNGKTANGETGPAKAVDEKAPAPEPSSGTTEATPMDIDG